MTDTDDEKSTVYVTKSRLRVFTSRDGALKWLLSCCERGMYITDVRLLASDGEVHKRAAGTGVTPDPLLSTFRQKSKIGRPPARKRRGETTDEKRKRQNRESSARYRARQKEAQ